MTHYDVLGVSRAAGAAELRTAYLRLVREHHPDRHAGSPPAVREAAENRMRSINEAWRELGDPERRRRYDDQIDLRPHATVVDHGDASSWRPFDDGPDFVDGRLDDSDRPPPRGGRFLAMGPPAVLTMGVVVLIVGLAVGVRFAIALGAMGIILGGALFVVASLSVVLESRQNDRP